MSKFGFNRSQEKMNLIKQDLPKVIANDSIRFFLSGYKKQGFENKIFEAWKPRLNKGKGRDLTRSILVDSGALRRSLSNSVKLATWELIKFQVEVPYAGYINYGTDKMVARKFIGKSKELDKQIFVKINKVVSKIWLG